MQFTGIGSMLAVHFTRGPVRSPADAAKGDQKLKELFFFDMLAQGIWLARRGMFTLCLPIGDAECDRLAAAVEEFLSSRSLLAAIALSLALPRHHGIRMTAGNLPATKGRAFMLKSPSLTRRHVLLGAAGTLFAPAIARAATRGVSDTEIIVGSMADLSGVTAVQGVNNAGGMRMAFDEVECQRRREWPQDPLHRRGQEYIVPEGGAGDEQAGEPRQHLLRGLGNGGTPMNDAVMPMMFEKNVPNVFPTTCARSMYEPFNKLKFGQFASYYDQMRAGVKYFAEKQGKKTIGVMYQDTDYGRDVLAGARAQVEAMGLKLGGTTGHKPTDTDFNGAVAKLRDANCDLIVLGSIVKDTVLILQTAHKNGLEPDLHGQFRHLLHRGGRGAGRSGRGVLLDVAGALSLSG